MHHMNNNNTMLTMPLELKSKFISNLKRDGHFEQDSSARGKTEDNCHGDQTILNQTHSDYVDYKIPKSSFPILQSLLFTAVGRQSVASEESLPANNRTVVSPTEPVENEPLGFTASPLARQPGVTKSARSRDNGLKASQHGISKDVLLDHNYAKPQCVIASNIKLHSCRICKKTYTQKTNLGRHMRIVHRNTKKKYNSWVVAIKPRSKIRRYENSRINTNLKAMYTRAVSTQKSNNLQKCKTSHKRPLLTNITNMNMRKEKGREALKFNRRTAENVDVEKTCPTSNGHKYATLEKALKSYAKYSDEAIGLGNCSDTNGYELGNNINEAITLESAITCTNNEHDLGSSPSTNEQSCSLQSSDSEHSLACWVCKAVHRNSLSKVNNPRLDPLNTLQLEGISERRDKVTQQAGPPMQDMTSGWIQPESDNNDSLEIEIECHTEQKMLNNILDVKQEPAWDSKEEDATDMSPAGNNENVEIAIECPRKDIMCKDNMDIEKEPVLDSEEDVATELSPSKSNQNIEIDIECYNKPAVLNDIVAIEKESTTGDGNLDIKKELVFDEINNNVSKQEMSTQDRRKIETKFQKSWKAYSCPQCRRMFESKTSAEVHMKLAHAKIPFQSCNKRKQMLSERSTMRRQLKWWDNITREGQVQSPLEDNNKAIRSIILDGEKLFVCAMCNHKSASKSDIEIHMNLSHCKPKNVTCTVCRKSFQGTLHLIAHKISKECKILSALERTSVVQDDHTEHGLQTERHNDQVYSNRDRSHKDQIVKLPNPLRQYLQKKLQKKRDNLKTDSKTKHKHMPQARLLSSPQGAQTFNKKVNVKRDIDQVHYKEKPLSCSICRRTFFMKWQLRSHLKKHHFIVNHD